MSFVPGRPVPGVPDWLFGRPQFTPAPSPLTSYYGLPELDTISFRVGEPAKPSEIVAFAFGIDRDTFGYQTVQHSIEVIHLEVDHRSLCRRKVFIILPEEGKDDLSALRRCRKREATFGP